MRPNSSFELTSRGMPRDTNSRIVGNPVNIPKAECELLMNKAIPFAEQMLVKHGEFFPYGQALTTSGTIVAVAAYDGTEQPPSADLIRLLKQGFTQGARSGKHKATALVYDVSPGPSFLMVARTALAVSRKDGLAAAAGMGVGSIFFSVIALFGMLAILAAVPLLHLGLKVLGGAYLIYLGYHIWRSARQPLVVDGDPMQSRAARPWRSFVLGLLTQVSNPKTAVVYASVFASLLPSHVPLSALVALPITIFGIETTWYSVVALALSAPTPRARYLASRAWLDHAAGAIMSVLGLKLIFEAQQP